MSADLALELGSSVTRVADARGEILLEEPTIAAVDADSRRLLAFGNEALAIGTASARRVSLIRPVRHGQLTDIALAEDVLVEVLRAAGASRLVHPRILACVHAGATHVQQRALDRALRRAGARQVRFVEQPVACAIGAGLPIEEPLGSMVVDVGGGTTDIGVLALGALVTSASLPVGGDDFDEAVRLMLARRFDVIVDAGVAADVRRRIGTVLLPDKRPAAGAALSAHLEVRGRDAASGLPRAVVVSAAELFPPLDELLQPVLTAATKCVASAPPDIANDLLVGGLHLAGGGSKLDGLDARLAVATGLDVFPVADPERTSITGAARCLGMLDVLSPALSAAPRR